MPEGVKKLINLLDDIYEQELDVLSELLAIVQNEIKSLSSLPETEVIVAHFRQAANYIKEAMDQEH